MKNLTLLFLLFCFALQAQVGIGTTTPSATLDITGKPTSTTNLDGVIAPRLTGNQLRAKTYTAAQTAAIVFVTTADTAPAGQTIDVTEEGYYYFNGTKWVNMVPAESKDWKLAGNSNSNENTDFIGTSNDQDLIFKRNNVQSGWLDTSNTAFGYNTINPLTNTIDLSASPTEGVNNTAIGLNALQSNTAGHRNTAIGMYAMKDNTSGYYNTAIGHTALQQNTTGNRNTAVGSGAMTLNTTGYWNSALGRFALHDNTTGFVNMAIGQEAAKFNTTGDSNVAIGFAALKNNTTGSRNIAIGRSAMSGGTVGVAYGSNNIVIGYNTQLPSNSSSNQMVLGNTSSNKTIINGIANSAVGAPSSSSATGVQGEIRVAVSGSKRYLYICYSTNSWGRVELDTSF